MSIISEFILTGARTHLNDDNAINWPDPNLFPKYQEAFRDLRLELELNGIQVVQEVSADITVPAFTTDITDLMPADLITPIWMKEKQVGETDSFLIDMTPIDFIPDVDQDITLNWWCWQQNRMLLLGALNDVIIQLRYRCDLALPLLNSSMTGVTLGESFLTYRTAAIAFSSVKDFQSANRCDTKASENLMKLIKFFTTYEKQILPAKRQPYHRRNWYSNVIRSV
jgi:hypothetical protein